MTADRLLAIDTATEHCSVALAMGGRVHELAENVGQKHSEHALPMVQQLLADHGVDLASLQAIAFGAGPGSFTGLRIACGIAQGLAYGLDLPVVPVGNLAAVALSAQELAPSARRVAAAIDARMNECYWAVCEIAGGRVRELVPPSLSAAGDLPALLAPHAPDALAGDAFRVFAAQLDSIAAAHRLPQARAGAGSIARLALPLLAAGRALPAAQAMPVYVRDRVALTIDERRAAAAEKAG